MNLTEDQIEIRVEAHIDRADRAFMERKITQAEYDRRVTEISRWADAQYRNRGRS